MRKIRITDITIRENDSLSFKEKVEMAKIMDQINFSSIELSKITNPEMDALLIKTLTTTVKDNRIVCPVELDKEKIKAVWGCLKKAKRPVLKVEIPTSIVQMEYVCHKKPTEVLKMVSEYVAEAKKYCGDVEFSAGDATRAEEDFLHKCVKAAIDAGATKITLCDTAGTMMPDEFEDFVEDVIDEVPEIKDICLSVEVTNELDMATACAFAAIEAGADEIKTAIKNDRYPQIEDVINVIDKRGNDIKITSTIRKTELSHAISKMSWITAPKNKGVSEAVTAISDNNSSIDLSISLTMDDDVTTVAKAAKKIGYDLSPEDKINVFAAFQRVATKKDTVGRKELEAIIATESLKIPATYEVKSYVINSGNIIKATANICLEKDGEEFSGVFVGDGPIDAAFMAIESILGHHYELDDFQIQAVTEGREAMGQALVKLRADNGKLYSGSAVSTDIIGASVRAYINAINKIIYEEA
ncbi:MAG: hypothetical protein GX241_05000 [Ruminococcaceae bacterium]|nr:hypothetical protein [Oscillospiraceae bacterium]